MTILLANAIFTPNKIYHDYGIVFDKTILKIAPKDELLTEFGNQCQELGEGSILMSGLINSHVHLEFSANRSTLEYGEFMPWLSSVMSHRDDLIHGCEQECMQYAIDSMLKSGTTAFGAVSSYGFDLDACAIAPQKVVYFNELIGSDPLMADALYGNFQERLLASQECIRVGFYPSIAIHSPYSVHRVILKKALKYAQAHQLRTTAHFMESVAEREWLDNNSGDFAPFFANFLKQTVAANTASEFLDYFDAIPTLFTHAAVATSAELAKLSRNRHTVIHCPISNRLLGNGALNLSLLQAQKTPFAVGTDGLSSNYSLDLFEEMKIALFTHHSHDLISLAKALWEGVTCVPAHALRLNCGTIAPNYDADVLVVHVDYPINDQLPIHLITQPRRIDAVYIQGEKVV